MYESLRTAKIQAIPVVVALAPLHAGRTLGLMTRFPAAPRIPGTGGVADASGIVEILSRADFALAPELAPRVAASLVRRRTNGGRFEFFVEFTLGSAASIVTADARVAFLALFALVIPAKRFGFRGETVGGFRF